MQTAKTPPALRAAVNKLYEARGGLEHCLALFGDQLAKREGYKDLDGLDAVRYYLMEKHHWLPRDLRFMSTEDLHFALSHDMAGWTPPEAARS